MTRTQLETELTSLRNEVIDLTRIVAEMSYQQAELSQALQSHRAAIVRLNKDLELVSASVLRQMWCGYQMPKNMQVH